MTRRKNRSVVDPLHRRVGAARGLALLEQAMVLPLVLLTVFAAIDANSVIQAYGALREGVKESLRCVYPVDGACISANVNPPTRLYDWLKVQRTPDSAVITYVDYRGKIAWLQQPREIYDSMRATVLNQVTLRVQRHRYELPNVTVPLTAKMPVLMVGTGGPLASASSSFQARFASLTYKESEQSYPALTGVDQSDPDASAVDISDLQVTMSSKSSQQVSFRIPFPPMVEMLDDEVCVVTKDFDKKVSGARTPDLKGDKLCSDAVDLASQKLHSPRTKIPFVIHVKGSTHHTYDPADPTSYPGCGLGLELHGPGLDKDVDDGGMMFGSPNDDNFVPRGGPPEYAGGEVQGSEFTKHRLWAVPSATSPTESGSIFLSVQLSPTVYYNGSEVAASPDCAWEGTEAKIYLPEITTGTLDVQCSDVTLQEQQDGTAVCHVTGLVGIPPDEINHAAVIGRTVAKPSRLVFGTPQTIVVENALNESHAREIIRARGILTDAQVDALNIPPPTATWEETVVKDCAAIATSESGGQPNYGVPGDPNGSSYALATAICPPSVEPMQQFGAQAISATYTTVDALLPVAHQGQAHTITNCSDTTIEFDGPRVLYPQLIPGSPNPALTTYPAKIPTHDVDPFVVATDQDNPYYTDFGSCGKFPPHGIIFDDTIDEPHDPHYDYPQIPADSWFVEPRPALFDDCRLSRMHEDALEQAGEEFNDEYYFDLTVSEQLSEQQVGGGTECSDTHEPPRIDECIPFRTSPGQVCSEVLVATMVPEGTVPPPCNDGQTSCQSTFAAFSGEYQGGREASFDLAAEVGNRAIAAAYPRAQTDCTGDHCVTFAVRKTEDKKRFVSEASMQVPLTLLLGNPLTISYRDYETDEIEFVK